MIQSYHIDQICYLAVICAWSLEYCGDKVLLKIIDDLTRLPAKKNYANVVPVAQSSGTGKFKTVDRISTEQILFPLCLCESLSKKYIGR